VSAPAGVVPNPLVVAQRMDKGAILMDTSSGECFELNAVGADVWSGIEQGRSFDDIAHDLAQQYRLPPDQIRTDIEDLLASLLRCGVVRLREP
jgi:Coenzyme PQQ synthesis protein D (PqqD)